VRRTWTEPTRHKYRAKAVTVHGVRFPSTGQARRYQDLRLREEAGEITDLKLDPSFPIQINGEKVCTVIADFSYRLAESGEVVIEDFKGMATLPIYRLKKKLVHACYGIDIVETTRKDLSR
jgi:UDP-N-acetyl-D-mannosaminuronic acid transferase (WecB/TagA/CpsF family)